MKKPLLVIILCVLASFSYAATYYVAPNGSDSNNGSSSSPWGSIQYAVNQLSAGDILILKDGAYYQTETIIIDGIAGTENNPVIIRAETPGEAVITSTIPELEAGSVSWEDLGNGFYRTSTAFARKVRTSAVWYKSDGTEVYLPYLDAWDGTNEYGNYGLKYLKARYNKNEANNIKEGRTMNVPHGIAQDEDGYIYVYLKGGASPVGQSIIPKVSVGGSTFEVNNSQYVVFDGLSLKSAGGFEFYSAEGAMSTNCVVRNCVLQASGGISPGNGLIVEWTEAFSPGVIDFMNDLSDVNDFSNPMWNIFKGSVASPGGGDLVLSRPDRNAPAVENVTIRYCYMHELWDGEKIGTTNNSRSHHNIYENCFDNATELETLIVKDQKVRNIHWHHNLVLGRSNAHLAFQDQALGTTTIEGPIYVYRNVFRSYTRGWDPWVFLKSRSENVDIYFYHNLWSKWTGSRGFQNSNAPLTNGTFEFRNNILTARSWRWHKDSDDDGIDDYWGLPVPTMYRNMMNINEFTVGHPENHDNLWVEYEQGGNELDLIDPQDVGGTPDLNTMNFAPASPNSPVVDKGEVLNIPEIPDLQSNAVGVPDIGPFEYGETMEDWPRPRARTFTTAPVNFDHNVTYSGGTNEAPVISFTNLANGDELTGSLTINAFANDSDIGSSDGDGIDRVEFTLKNDGSTIETRTENLVTYDWPFNTTDYDNGDYTLEATAYTLDNDGPQSTTASVSFTVNNPVDCNGEVNGNAEVDDCGVCAGGNTGVMPGESCDAAPVIFFTNVSEGDELSGSLTINMFANDPDVGSEDGDGIDRVELILSSGGSTIESRTENNVTYDWPQNTTELDNGSYTLKATAHTTDEGGPQSTTGSVSFTVNNVRDCNGDLNGSAFIDSCGNCAGGNTGLDPVTDPNACEPTAISSPDRTAGMMAYPNPFSNLLTVEVPAAGMISIIDAQGRLIQELNVKEGINLIDFDLETGIYQLLYRYDDKQGILKVIRN